jgi:hypothetical protein
MSRKLISTGNLRAFLSEAMVQMRDGNLRVEELSTLASTASAINNSLLAEIRYHRLQLDMGQQVDKFGQLVIGDADGNEKVRNPPEEQ